MANAILRTLHHNLFQYRPRRFEFLLRPRRIVAHQCHAACEIAFWQGHTGAYSEVGLRGVVERNRIARIDCYSFLIGGNSLVQVSLPALHRSNVETDIAIIRKSLRCQVQFAQSFLVVALLVIEIESEREMAFAEIRLEAKRFVRFTTCGFFDLLCRFEPMIDHAHNR